MVPCSAGTKIRVRVVAKDCCKVFCFGRKKIIYVLIRNDREATYTHVSSGLEKKTKQASWFINEPGFCPAVLPFQTRESGWCFHVIP